MKWPEVLTLVRHDTSAYNELESLKEENPLYQQFRRVYETAPNSDEARKLALAVNNVFTLTYADHNTPLAEGSGWQAEAMARKLKEKIAIPTVVFVSPYDRTHKTLECMQKGWPELEDVKTVEEERIREQDHGLAVLYCDWRVFNALHPEQRELYDKQGRYWYRYPQGENVPDMRERLRSFTTTLTRDYPEQSVLTVTHHLAILGFRANMERWSAEDFKQVDKHDKPVNAGVTIYRGHPDEGENGRLLLDIYNAQLY